MHALSSLHVRAYQGPTCISIQDNFPRLDVYLTVLEAFMQKAILRLLVVTEGQ